MVAYVLEHCHYNNKDLYIVSYTSVYNTLKIKVQSNNSLNIEGTPDKYLIFFPPGATQPIVGVYFTALYRSLASSRTRLLDHTQLRATVGRTPLNE